MANTSSPHERDLRVFTRKVLIALSLLSLFVLTFIGLFFIGQFLLLIFGGVLLAVLLRSFGQWLSRALRLRPNIATGVGIALILGLSLLITFLSAPSLIRQSKQLAQIVPASVEQVKQNLNKHEWFGNLMDQVPPADFTMAQKTLSGLTSVAGGLTAVLFIIVVGIYLALDPKTYQHGTISMVPKARRSRFKETLQSIQIVLSQWMTGMLVDMFIVGCLTTLGLLLLQIPMAILLGVIAGVLNFIPTFGPVIAAIPALLITFTHDPHKVLHVGLLYLAIQVVESNLIAPLILSRTIHLPPALILITQIIFGIVFGFMGLVLAIPLLATSIVLVKMLYLEEVAENNTEGTL